MKQIKTGLNIIEVKTSTLIYLYYLILLAFLLSDRLSLRNSCLAKAGTVTPLLKDSFLLSLCLQIVMEKILFVGLKLEKGTIKVNCRWTTIYIDLFSELCRTISIFISNIRKVLNLRLLTKYIHGNFFLPEHDHLLLVVMLWFRDHVHLQATVCVLQLLLCYSCHK